MGITADNYLVEIWTNSGLTNAAIGLTAGVYQWAINDAEGVYTVGIIADEGVIGLGRSVDVRTGGGIATTNAISITLMGGIYSQIEATDPIIGKRVTISHIEWNGSSYDKTEKYVGAVNSPDVEGFATVLQCKVESVTRGVDLPVSSGAIGDVAIDGTVKGEKTYITTKGAKAYFSCFDVPDTGVNPQEFYIEIKGATPSTQAELQSTVELLQSKIDIGNSVYCEGQDGTYKISSAYKFGGRYILEVTRGARFSVVQGEEGNILTVYYTSEVYNEGLQGNIVVDGVEVEDYNAGIIASGAGSAICASDGIIYKRLIEGTDYNTALDQYLPYTNTLAYTLAQDGVSYAGIDTVPSGSTAGARSQTTDWSKFTWGNFKVQSPLSNISSVGYSIEFDFTGYKLSGDRLALVIDVESEEDFTTEDGGTKSIGAFIESYQGGDSSAAPTGSPIKSGIIGIGTSDTIAGVKTACSMPAGYGKTGVEDDDRYTFYNPNAFGIVDEGTDPVNFLYADITEYIKTIEDQKILDEVRLFVMVVYTNTNMVSYGGIRVRQVNIVEGYNVGVDGLSSNKVQIDNADTNGTIPLAYEDTVKRQNFFGINSTAPSEGWGTAQVETDGAGVAIDANYLTTSVTAGALEGVIADPTTDKVKREVARSIPAVSYYDRKGVESLYNIGEWNATPAITLTYDMVKGDIDIKGYDGRDIQPSLSFEFGTDKKLLQINNTEASAYSSAYIVDEIGLSDVQKEQLWNAGRLLYTKYGTSTSQTVSRYPIVNDAAGAYRIASALYSNMGVLDDTFYSRSIITANIRKGTTLDIGTAVAIDMPQYDGVGVISSVLDGVYAGTNKYTIEAIETAGAIFYGDILQTGSQVTDVLQDGTKTDNILQDGV